MIPGRVRLIWRAEKSEVKYEFNSVSKFIIIFISTILFFFLPELDRKTKKFKVENHFVKRKPRKGIYLVCELRSA